MVLKLADVLVSLSQDVKYPLPSIPMQQVVTEVRDEKLGISSQRSPRACRVSQEERQWCSTTASVCDDNRARFSQDDFRPILWRRALVEVLLRHHCHVQTKMTIDSSHWHSSASTDPSCDSVHVQCGMPQSHTGSMGQHCSRVELATTAVVDHHSTNPTDGHAHCLPNVLQSDREYS